MIRLNINCVYMQLFSVCYHVMETEKYFGVLMLLDWASIIQTGGALWGEWKGGMTLPGFQEETRQTCPHTEQTWTFADDWQVSWTNKVSKDKVKPRHHWKKKMHRGRSLISFKKKLLWTFMCNRMAPLCILTFFFFFLTIEPPSMCEIMPQLISVRQRKANISR